MTHPDAMRERIDALVRRRLAVLGEELGKPALACVADETRLLGGQSPIDSIGLVTLIADLEGDIQREFGRSVILADEMAMSRSLSPFRSVGSLVEHIHLRLS